MDVSKKGPPPKKNSVCQRKGLPPPTNLLRVPEKNWSPAYIKITQSRRWVSLPRAPADRSTGRPHSLERRTPSRIFVGRSHPNKANAPFETLRVPDSLTSSAGRKQGWILLGVWVRELHQGGAFSDSRSKHLRDGQLFATTKMPSQSRPQHPSRPITLEVRRSSCVTKQSGKSGDRCRSSSWDASKQAFDIHKPECQCGCTFFHVAISPSTTEVGFTTLQSLQPARPLSRLSTVHTPHSTVCIFTFQADVQVDLLKIQEIQMHSTSVQSRSFFWP